MVDHCDNWKRDGFRVPRKVWTFDCGGFVDWKMLPHPKEAIYSVTDPPVEIYPPDGWYKSITGDNHG